MRLNGSLIAAARNRQVCPRRFALRAKVVGVLGAEHARADF